MTLPVNQGRIQGGGGRAPLSESLGIDFYSGFRKKNPGMDFNSGFREKNHKVQFEILRKPGIYLYSGFREKKTPGMDFYSGFRKKIQVYTFIVASEKNNTRGVQFEILNKSRYRLL